MTTTPQNLYDVVTRLRSPNGVKKQSINPNVSAASGHDIVEFLLASNNQSKRATKPEILQCCQALTERGLIVPIAGPEPRKFAEDKKYKFQDLAISALERSLKGPSADGLPRAPVPRRPPPTSRGGSANRGIPVPNRTAPIPNGGASTRGVAPPNRGVRPPPRKAFNRPVAPPPDRPSAKIVPPPPRRVPSAKNLDNMPKPLVQQSSNPTIRPRVPPSRKLVPPPAIKSPSTGELPPRIPPHPRGNTPTKTTPVIVPPSIKVPAPVTPSLTKPSISKIAKPPPPRVAPRKVPTDTPPPIAHIPPITITHGHSDSKLNATPPPKKEISPKSSFAKAQPSRPRVPSNAPLHLGGVRTLSSDKLVDKKPTASMPARPDVPSRKLIDSHSVLASTTAETTTTRGQLINAEKSYVLTCSSGLQGYSNASQLTRDDKEILFSNLDCLVEVHTKALSNVSSTTPASVFLRSIIPHLHLYLPYIANLSNAFDLLGDLRERGVFFENQKDLPAIDALLERPRQFVVDYPAVITSLIDSTDPTDPEHKELCDVLTGFENVCRQINQRNLLPKHLMHLWDIEQSFIQSENLQLRYDRELFQEGFATLLKSNTSRKDGEKLRVFIFRGLVIIAALHADGYSWESILKSNPEELIVRDVDEWENSLEFECGGSSITLSTAQPSVKPLWMNCLPVQYPNGRKKLKMALQI